MFMALYYQHYLENCKGEYWIEPVSLPYAVWIPQAEDRAELTRLLDADGFGCVVSENGYPIMYVNFTLKRYGRNVKACHSGSINPELLTKEQFLDKIFKRYKADAAFQEYLCDNYAESAAIEIDKCKQDLQNNISQGSADEQYTDYARRRLQRLREQVAKSVIHTRGCDGLTLCAERTERLWVTVTAKLFNGCLVIEGQDLGGAAADFWGQDEYEYFYEFDRGNTVRLFYQAGGGLMTPREALLDKFSGTSGCRALRTFCEENGIVFKFHSY